MKTTTNHDVIEKVMQEHDVLRDKVHQIHAVLAEPKPTRDEIHTLLREFLNALIVHFWNEEDEGFFLEVTDNAPHLAGQADRLCVEHKQLLREVDELCRFAAAGSPSMVWWRELSARCHEVSRRLMRHEREENKLLQQAYQDDLGIHN
jgi:iron-sulfur cluster repair protein YtfE (RIC family)